jgi:ATP-dependent helicase/nuclease subunit A
VPIVGRIGARSLSGQIDRLVVTPGEVRIVDYKTNRPPPLKAADVPPIYLGQMAAYRATLAAIYPGRRVRCALLWTDGPSLLELPEDLLDRHAP